MACTRVRWIIAVCADTDNSLRALAAENRTKGGFFHRDRKRGEEGDSMRHSQAIAVVTSISEDQLHRISAKAVALARQAKVMLAVADKNILIAAAAVLWPES